MRGIALGLLLVTAEWDSLAARPGKCNGEAIKVISGYPVVATFINGEGPFRMLIDTGAARCAVRPEVAARSGLTSKRQVLLTTLVSKKMVAVAVGAVRVGIVEVQAEILINDLPGLDGLDSHVDGLLGQSYLAKAPYLIDYKARRLWFGDEAIEKADRLSLPIQVELSYGRPILPVGVDSKMKPFRLLLDSGVDHLVLKCGGRCGHLIEERTVKAVTNAGTSSVQAGRLPVAMVGSRRFFRMPTVVLDEPSDPNNAEGSIPLNWFSAVYVNTAQSMIRFAR